MNNRANDAQKKVQDLCSRLAVRSSNLRFLVEHETPWSEIEPMLSDSRRMIEQLTEEHNDLERAIEAQYAADIAATEHEDS